MASGRSKQGARPRLRKAAASMLLVAGLVPVGCEQILGLNYELCPGDCDAAETGVKDSTPPDARGDASMETGLTPLSPIYRINCGGPPIGAFSGDYLGCPFCGGDGSDFSDPFEVDADIDLSLVGDEAPMQIFQSYRYDLRDGSTSDNSHFTYVFNNLTAGDTYQARLHFADIFDDAAGQREFNVKINGKGVLFAFDIIQTAGAPNKAIDRSFVTTADVNGNIEVEFVSTSAEDVACVNGIEIWSTK